MAVMLERLSVTVALLFSVLGSQALDLLRATATSGGESCSVGG